MGMATVSKHWTIDKVRALPDDRNRYEIIDGELFVTPAPAVVHQRAVLQLALRLVPYLKAQGLGEPIIAPADVEIAPDTMVEPDIFVIPPIAGALPRSWTDAERLLLVVEVLSPTSARADRVRKRALYARVRIPEYWIVDVDGRVVERWRPDPGRAGLTIDLVEYFAEVTGETLGATE